MMTEAIQLPLYEEDQLELEYWDRILYHSMHHQINLGATGAGKTTAVESHIKGLIAEGWKVVIVYSPKKEIRTLALPEVWDESLLDAMQREGLTPEAFNVQVKCPFFRSSAYYELENNEKKYLLPWMVDYFSIPVGLLNHEEIELLLIKSFSPSQRALIAAAQRVLVRDYGEDGTVFDLIRLCQSIANEGGVFLVQEDEEGNIEERMWFGMEAKKSLRSVAQSIIFPHEEGFISSGKSPHSLNLEEFINNTPQDCICAFELGDVPYWEYIRCIVAFLSRKIFELKEMGRIKYNKICLVYLELSNLVPAMNEPGGTIVKNTLVKIVQKGRQIGIKLLTDTQLPMEVDQRFLAQLRTKYVMRLNNRREYDALCQLIGEVLDRKDLRECNMLLEIGEGFLIDGGLMANDVVTFPPLTAHHLMEGENFLEMLKYYTDKPMPIINQTLIEYLNNGKTKGEDLIMPLKDVTDLVLARQFNIEVEEQEGDPRDNKKVYILDLRNTIDLQQREIKHLRELLAEKQ